MWNTFDVNVMVNGSRCKQYDFENKKYIEAKDGSEWYFQIQNNSPGRVLAVCSVDGLNVLTGETATTKDTGYIIDSYNAQKIKGFRFSDDEWALFKFGYKVNKSTGKKNDKVYAVSKGGGADKNCGVIGVRLFYEKVKKVEYIAPPKCNYIVSSSYSMNSSYNYGTGSISGNVNWSAGNSNGLYGPGRFGLNNMTEDYYIPVRGAGGQNVGTDRNSLRDRFNRVRSTSYNAYTKKKGIISSDCHVEKKIDFDIGTEFGKRETSKVQTIDFNRGVEAYFVDIYYASRQALENMDVPLSNLLKVNKLPESFPSKYCKLPENWNG